MNRAFQPRPFLYMLAVPCFALLCGLGVWQLQRLAWKNDLLAAQAAREATPALDIDSSQALVGLADFTGVRLRGDLDLSRFIGFFGRTANGRQGQDYYAPLTSPISRSSGSNWAGARPIPQSAPTPIPASAQRRVCSAAPCQTGRSTGAAGAATRVLIRATSPSATSGQWPIPRPSPPRRPRSGADAGAAGRADRGADRRWLCAHAHGQRTAQPHLSYAVQWFSFAALLVLFVALLSFPRRPEKDPAPMTDYATLEALNARAGTLGEALSILHWDQQAMMPAGGREARGADRPAGDHDPRNRGRTRHGRGDRSGIGPERPRPVAAGQRRRIPAPLPAATALPADLVAAKARAESQAFAVWQQARPADDFAAALPSLRTWFDLARQAGQAIADATGQPLYEAMIEGFEPDLSVAEIDAVFDDYAAFLPDFLDDVLSAQDRREPPLPLEGPFDVEQQKAVFQKIMGALGFDFEHGRLDTSAHPFCGGTPTDVRMTTRYRDAPSSMR